MGDQLVEIHLKRAISEIENTILVIGSHDLLLEEIAKYLIKKDRRLVSVNVGSLSGLISLNQRKCHLAGAHLLDPETGEYNRKYISEFVSNVPITSTVLAKRDQGLIVEKGNPLGILSIKDLTRPEVRFINRQRGSGTRVLLDFHLRKNLINPENIRGYQVEEYTHINVASAVLSERANCGLGVAAAADVFSLDFIPLFQERYDLIINNEFLENQFLKPMVDLLSDPEFRQSISRFHGYDVKLMGQIIVEN